MNHYWVHMEWFCDHAGILRIFEKNSKFGDPYENSIAFKVVERYNTPKDGKIGMLEFVGVVKPLNKYQFYAICEMMKKEKFGVLGSTYQNGERIVKEFCKNKWRKE
jgi:hypothetical protein